MLSGKNILVTGGTGSFGKEFVKLSLNRFPNLKKIIVFSRDEFKQFEMNNEPEFKNNGKLKFVLGDIRDSKRLEEVFSGIDIVIHAAALKQVDICEKNPFETIKTNIDGTINVVNASIKCNVEKVLALGTDKACEPVSVYGASKFCSDRLIIASNSHPAIKNSKFSVVRCGILIGSRGSVIPYFHNLVMRGALELPITDFRMTRFWVSTQQVVEMIFTALNIMQGGELFVKKAPSMKITDLAKVMAPNIKLKEIGMVPGEKLYEVMISAEESSNAYDFGDYYVIFKEFNDSKVGYSKYNSDNKVENSFVYRSDTNIDWLSMDLMANILIKNGYINSYDYKIGKKIEKSISI